MSEDQSPAEELQAAVSKVGNELEADGYHAMVVATDSEHCAVSVQGEGRDIMNGLVTAMCQDDTFRSMIFLALMTYKDVVTSDDPNETIQ